MVGIHSPLGINEKAQLGNELIVLKRFEVVPASRVSGVSIYIYKHPLARYWIEKSRFQFGPYVAFP